ncbi:MAG: insulinase family protein [Firmicutes bacterium]|nr:insulinase family protein [Bacillota bacterium]
MIKRATLDNGLPVVCEQIPYVRSVSIGFWVACGSRNETMHEQGISHLIEHMAFKGTKNRTAREIAESIDAVGGHLNAFTTKEYTCFYVKLLDRHFRLGLDLLADLVINSVFSPEELEKEKNVVLEEVKMYEDSPDELVFELFTQALLQDHPLGHSILGTPESIKQLNRDALLQYKERYYTPHNSCLAIAGNFDFDGIIKESNHFWHKLTGEFHPQPEQTFKIQGQDHIRFKDTEQVHLCLGTPGFSRQDSNRYALVVLNSILGGSSSSRLFQTLREERGLVYVTGSYYSAFRDLGLFSIYAGTSLRHYEEVLTLIRKELFSLQENLVSEEELNRVKEQIKGNMWLGLENTSNRMGRLAKGELFYGRYISPEEELAQIEQVTREDLQRVAQMLFTPAQLTLAAIGPFPQAETISGLLVSQENSV